MNNICYNNDEKSRKKGKGVMQACHLTISTKTDGRESKISRQGKMDLSLLSAQVVYLEENAEVKLSLENGIVTIHREGDYSLFLVLEKGQIREGTLGLNGATGIIHTKTRRLAYSLTENSLLLSLHYELLTGGEPQDMHIRLFAKLT